MSDADTITAKEIARELKDMDEREGRRASDQKAVDALNRANEAMAEISAHERECSIRYEHINGTLIGMREDLNKSHHDNSRKLWILIGVVFTGMVGIIGALVA